MAKINSSEVSKAVDGLRLSSFTDKIPNEIEDKVKLVYEISPNQPDKRNQVVASAQSTTTNGVTTVYTTNDTKDSTFYLCSADLSFQQTVAGVTTEVRLEVTPYGQTTQVHILSFQLNATAAVKEINKIMVFQRPIAIAPGTVIRMGNNTSAGAVVQRANITGFYT